MREKVRKITELEEQKLKLQQDKLKRDFESNFELRKVEMELSKLPLKYQNPILIDVYILRVGKLMMNTAKIEEENEMFF